MPLDNSAFEHLARTDHNPYVRELNRLQEHILVRDERIKELQEALSHARWVIESYTAQHRELASIDAVLKDK